MRSTSSFRRVGGLLAVTTLGMSTAVLSAAGVAQAAPTSLTTPVTLTVPEDVCTIQWVVNGEAGEDVDGVPGGDGTQITLQMPVLPGEQYEAEIELAPGGAGGTGAGGGGDGIGLIIDEGLAAVAAGGGGAGTLSPGGADGLAGELVPSSDGVDDWLAGGYPGSAEEAGMGGDMGTEVLSGFVGGNAVDDTGGDAGGPGAGGGGGGYFGGGAGASNGSGGAGGGGGSSYAGDGEVGTSTGAASVTYEFLACSGTDVPLAPADLYAYGDDGELTVEFTPAFHDGGGVDAETWEYKVGADAWAPVDPEWTEGETYEFVLDGLTNGTAYTVYVRGVSADGVHGDVASVTEKPYKPIGAPGNIQVSTSNSVVTFTWGAPTVPGTYALDGYVGVLAVNNGESGGPVHFCENTAAQRVCEAPVAPGLNYEVMVFAFDSEGNDGDWSEMVPVGEVAPPASVPPSDGPLQGPPSGSNGVGQGEKITITGSGYAPDTMVTILIYSQPQVLTSVWTDHTGSFTVEVTIPAGLAAGQHTLVAAGVDPNGALRYLTLPVTVTEATAVLAYTGADIALPAYGGLAALAVGGGLLFAGRRRPVVAATEVAAQQQ